MLHTKFLGNRFMGSGEVVFKDGHGGHLGHVTSIMLLKFFCMHLKDDPIITLICAGFVFAEILSDSAHSLTICSFSGVTNIRYC